MPSKLEQLQQQYRRQLLQEKEEKMIKIHTESQQKALSKISRYNGISSVPTVNPQPHHSPVKKGSPGVDRSRPLPPIVKERNAVSNRTSPVSAPIDSASKMASVSSRSKSVDLVDSRPSPQRPVQNDRGNLRNGYSRVPEAEVKSSASVEYERRPDPEALAKMRLAELQRIRAKARDETPPRSNGFTGAISKSSNNTAVPKKTSPAKPPGAAAASTRTRPPLQGATASTNRRPAAPTSRSAPRGAAPANGRKPPGPGQEQCRVCGRNFNTDRIEKHISVCSKASQKKVKVFDATKMRVKGTEAEQFVRKGLPKTEPKAKKTDWRKQHSEFIEAIRQAKMVQQHLAKGGKVSDLPPPPPSDTSNYVPCPYCERKFSPGVADRHIPKCKNILSNKKNPVPKRK